MQLLGKNNLARQYFEQSLEIAHSLQDHSLLINVLEQYKNFCLNQNDVETYARLDKEYELYYDSVYNIANIHRISNQLDSGQLQEKESIIRQLKRQARSQKTLFFIVLLVGISLGSLFIILLSKWISKQLKILAKSNRRWQEQAEVLEEKMESKDREMVSQSIELAAQKELLKKIQKDLDKTPNQPETNKVSQLISQNLNNRDNWEQFRQQFTLIHPNFFKTLQSQYPGLTKNDLRLCSYFKLNLSNKEIAKMLNISSESLIKARYRLKKKMNLGKEDNLDETIASL